jgi:broad specificity phosphatase PhoE
MFGTEEYDFGCITDEENKQRTRKFVEYLKERFTYGQCVVVACHYATCEYLVAAALGLKEWDFHFAFTYTSATMVEIFPEGYSLLRCLNAMD